MEGCKCGNYCEICPQCSLPLCECVCGTLGIEYEEEDEHCYKGI